MFSFNTDLIIIGKRADMRRQVKELQKKDKRATVKIYWKYLMNKIKKEA